jgi:hypothetical protein
VVVMVVVLAVGERTQEVERGGAAEVRSVEVVMAGAILVDSRVRVMVVEGLVRGILEDMRVALKVVAPRVVALPPLLR